MSGSPTLLDGSLSDLKETDKDCSSQDTLIPVYAIALTIAIGATIALILHIYLGENSVCHAIKHMQVSTITALFILIIVTSQVFVKGVLVSDHERCNALGQKVLHDRGSSVDAAIAAALCLGVVHPHLSGVGGYVSDLLLICLV